MAIVERFGCNYESLLTGLDILLRGLLHPSRPEKTISASLELAAKGLGANRGGLFLIRYKPASIQLETIFSLGLTEQQIRAVECGEEVEQTRLSQVKMLISSQTCEISLATASEPRLRGVEQNDFDPHVLCLPVRDPTLDVLVAILHFEKDHENSIGFDAQARKWADSYCLALSQMIHLGFARERQEETGDTHTDSKPPEGAPELIGDSVDTQALRHQLHEVYIPAASAPDPDPIFLLGEKGTGKDLVSRYIYAYSTRRNRPYVALNCAEITDELATARFFGHKKGSFTGSLADEPGVFRAADHGVLFLDEIGDLSLRAQGALLRVLENRTVVPLGETRELRINVQVMLGTNCDPARAVAEGRIRADLLDRFRTQEIRLPPLRERPWDIPALGRHFIAHHENRTHKKTLGLHPDVAKMMVGYSWPGNVRELARVCSLLVTHAKSGSAIDSTLVRRLVPHISNQEPNPRAGDMLAGEITMRAAQATFERELILGRLRHHSWNIRSARESLGLPKTTFHRYTRTLGIAGSIREATTAQTAGR
jgi:DNA-binding NtrC family response regulator